VTREVFKSENDIINLCDRSKTLSGQFFEKFSCDEVVSWSLGGMGISLYDMFDLLYAKGSIKCGEFLDWLLKKDPAPWSE
jgi:hypothetical protein